MCTQATTDSKKYDQGKLRWDLLPLNLIEKVVEIYTFGAEKYGPNTWQNLEDGYNRYKAAMFRHLMEFEKGNVIDDESGKEHLAHMVWNAIAMLCVSQIVDKKQVIPQIGQKVRFEVRDNDRLWSSIGEVIEIQIDSEFELYKLRSIKDTKPYYIFVTREEIIEIL